VFAPGFEVGPPAYATLLEAWAAHGYVVAAIEFPLADSAVAGANLDENDIVNQPADVRFVTEGLISPAGPVAGRIDASRVAVAGHSDGAETALAASVAPVPAGDPPYRAVITMSVQPLTGASHTANPPILVTQGDADTINPPSYGYQTWGEAASPRYLVILHGGGHLPPLQAGSAWLPGIESTSEAFLDCFLAGKVPPSAIRAALPGSALFGLRVG
jgi:acetyl esterase/lipase